MRGGENAREGRRGESQGLVGAGPFLALRLVVPAMDAAEDAGSEKTVRQRGEKEGYWLGIEIGRDVPGKSVCCSCR